MLAQPAETVTGVDPALFRQSVSRFATGIAVVSCLDDAACPQGMTISSFTSISLDPATVLVSRFITPPLPGEGTATVLTSVGGAPPASRRRAMSSC